MYVPLIPDSITFPPLLVDGHDRLYAKLHSDRGLYCVPLDPGMAGELGATSTSYAHQVTE